MSTFFPTAIEQEGRGERHYDVISRLLKDRVIILTGEIDDDMSTSIISQLLFLESQSDDEIIMYINSPGGVITAGMAIYDTMNFIIPEIKTICIGQAASMGSFLLSAGTKGKRYSLPHSNIMIHQPLGGAGGQASDIKIHAEEMDRVKKELNKLLSKHTGKKLSVIEKDTDRDNFMTPKEAIEYGLIDKIIKKREE